MFSYEAIARTHHVGEVRTLDIVDGIFVVTFSSLWSSKKCAIGEKEGEISGTLNPF